MDPEIITPENVSGLVVGEGCFYCESAPDPRYRLRWRIRPAFCVEMRADDSEVLEGVRKHLDCGEVYLLDFGRYKRYADRGWHPHSKFRVTRVADLALKVVPFFERNPLFGRKKVAFDHFSGLVTMVHRKEHLTPIGLEQAKRIAAELAAHNSRGILSKGSRILA